MAFGYGSEFDQDLEQVTLPSGLQTWTSDSGFYQSLNKNKLAEWPSGLAFGRVL